MTFAANAELFTSKPVFLVEIAWDTGTEYYSKHDIEFSGQFYSGRVLSFGTISKAIANIDGEIQIANVTTTLSNLDGKFNSYDLEKFLNRVVTYKLGFAGDVVGNYETIFIGTIVNYEYSDDQLILEIQDFTVTHIEKSFGGVADPDDFLNGDPKFVGAKMPIIYGKVSGPPASSVANLVGG